VQGGTTDSIVIPVVRRRCARTDLLDRILDQDPEVASKAVYQSSMPIRFGVLSGHKLALVMMDPEHATGRLKGRMFVSLINLRTRKTCPDIALDLPADPMPRIAFSGDTLLALTQQGGADSSVTTTVHMLLVKPTECA
jgi:hypothetical protein